MDGLEYFRNRFGLREQDVLIFPYGSRVYGTANDKSDHDYIAVIPENRKADTGTEYVHGEINIHMYNRRDWQEQLNLHKIHTLEVYFLPDDRCRKTFKLDLNLGRLRHELSQKSSHSFVKAKKKIEKEHDFYVGWKSLFHSLRILTFGIQIATNGKITDYSAANQYWYDIRDAQRYDWDYFKEKYQPIYNGLATTFRTNAPKG